MLVPQIVSTEVLPEADAVTFHASMSGPANLTACGFGIVSEGNIREYPATLEESTLSFSSTTGDLSPDTEYAFYAFIANGPSRIQTPQRPFRTQSSEPAGPREPTLHFDSVSAVASVRSAVLSATISETEDVSEAGFSFSSDGIHFTDGPAALTGGGFSLGIENLEPDTEYRYAAWAVQRGVRVSSSPSSFRTEKEVHDVSFVSVEAQPEVFSALLSARVDDATWVEYCGFGLSREGRTAAEYGAAMVDNGFNVLAEALLPDTEYTFYAFVVVDGSRITSDFSRFRTREDTSVNISDISASATENAVKLQARLSQPGRVTAAGFGLAAEGGAYSEKAGVLEDDGRLSLHWEGLEAGTLYHFYVWAQTEEGRVNSRTLDFYTQEASSAEIRFVSVSAKTEGAQTVLEAILSGTAGISDVGFALSGNQYDYIEYGATLTDDGFRKEINGLAAGTYYGYAFFTLGGVFQKSDTFSFIIP